MKIITRYSSRNAPINDGLVFLEGCKSYENIPYPILLTLYSPSNQLEKVASIWASMGCRNSNFKQIPCSNSVPIINRPYMFIAPRTKPSKKWLPFELICAMYLDYIGTIHFVSQYPNLLTLYVHNTETLAVKKWLSFEPICAVDLEYIVTIHLVRPYLKFTDIICSVDQDPHRQKVASIWAYKCSLLRVHSNQSLCPSIPKLTDLICSVHQDPSCQKVASIWAYMCSRLWVNSNHSLCPFLPKFTYVICSVHQDPSRPNVASIWAYMCSILRIHINHILCPSIPKFSDRIYSVHQDPSHKKWLTFELISAVDLE